jgi:hypothetical protein
MNSDAITISTEEDCKVLLCSEIEPDALQKVLTRYGLKVCSIDSNTEIPGSFWQAPEAGLIQNRLYVRTDTPVHSALHEACHYICMDQQRRDAVHTDAGGGYAEEDAVCYLQILLAEQIPEMLSHRMFSDMDAWGYSFRLGSARAWFEQDAEDALHWLIEHQIVDHSRTPTGKLRID